MHRKRLLLASLATAVVTTLAACAPDAATAPAAHEGPALRAGSAPSARASRRGAVSVRQFGSIFGIITHDPRRQLTTILGATLAEAQRDCAGASVDTDPMQFRTLTTPSGKVHEFGKGEEFTVLVFNGLYDFVGDFCAFVTNTPLLATGTADFVITGGVAGPGATHPALHAQGRVTNVKTGQLLHYVVRASILVTGNGTDKGYDNHIQLTPIGK